MFSDVDEIPTVEAILSFDPARNDIGHINLMWAMTKTNCLLTEFEVKSKEDDIIL